MQTSYVCRRGRRIAGQRSGCLVKGFSPTKLPGGPSENYFLVATRAGAKLDEFEKLEAAGK